MLNGKRMMNERKTDSESSKNWWWEHTTPTMNAHLTEAKWKHWLQTSYCRPAVSDSNAMESYKAEHKFNATNANTTERKHNCNDAQMQLNANNTTELDHNETQKERCTNICGQCRVHQVVWGPKTAFCG